MDGLALAVQESSPCAADKGEPLVLTKPATTQAQIQGSESAHPQIPILYGQLGCMKVAILLDLKLQDLHNTGGVTVKIQYRWYHRNQRSQTKTVTHCNEHVK